MTEQPSGNPTEDNDDVQAPADQGGGGNPDEQQPGDEDVPVQVVPHDVPLAPALDDTGDAEAPADEDPEPLLNDDAADDLADVPEGEDDGTDDGLDDD